MKRRLRQFIGVVLLLAGSPLPVGAQVVTWGDPSEAYQSAKLGVVQSDSGNFTLYYEFRARPAPGKAAPLGLLLLKRTPDKLGEMLEIYPDRLLPVGNPPDLLQVLYLGTERVPRFDLPYNQGAGNLYYEKADRSLRLRWKDEAHWYAEWEWDEVTQQFVHLGKCSYTVTWSTEGEAPLQRRTFADVPIPLLAGAHGIRPRTSLPREWTASGSCTVRTPSWSDPPRAELHGYFRIQYSAPDTMNPQQREWLVSLTEEGTWMEQNIPFGPYRIEGNFSFGTRVRALVQYAEVGDLQYATGKPLWGMAVCESIRKGKPQTATVYRDRLPAGSLVEFVEELQKQHGGQIPPLRFPSR
ncbi:MAG: hypothetical protein AAGN35_19005 [Bacteroidota bacterium]